MDSVPVWIVVIILGLAGALGAMLWNRRDKDQDDSANQVLDHETRITVLETTQVGQEKTIEKLEREIYSEPRGIIARLHKHGREIQEALSKIYLWERKK